MIKSVDRNDVGPLYQTSWFQKHFNLIMVLDWAKNTNFSHGIFLPSRLATYVFVCAVLSHWKSLSASIREYYHDASKLRFKIWLSHKEVGNFIRVATHVRFRKLPL